MVGCAHITMGLGRMSTVPRQGTCGIPHSTYISTQAIVKFEEVAPKDGSSLRLAIIFSCLGPNT